MTFSEPSPARLLLFLSVFVAVPGPVRAQRLPPLKPAATAAVPGANSAPGPAPVAPPLNPNSPVRVFTARVGDSLSIGELLGGGEGMLSIRTMDTGSISLSVKTRSVRSIAKPGPFLDKQDDLYTLPPATTNVSANGTLVNCNVPKTETFTLPDGRRAIPLLQAPGGGRLYMVNTLATRQGECLLVADLTIPLRAAAAGPGR